MCTQSLCRTRIPNHYRHHYQLSRFFSRLRSCSCSPLRFFFFSITCFDLVLFRNTTTAAVVVVVVAVAVSTTTTTSSSSSSSSSSSYFP